MDGGRGKEGQVTQNLLLSLFPGFVYAIISTLFLFFNIFALNIWLQYRKIGRWDDYLFGEHFYIVLSLLAKTALAWMIFAGTLAPV